MCNDARTPYERFLFGMSLPIAVLVVLVVVCIWLL
jgi:hypothetical protein